MLNRLLQIDWEQVFIPQGSLLEIILRGTLVYLSIFFLLRVVLKREAGSVGIADLLVVVLLADAAQNAMSADYRSVPEGVVLVATIVFWSYALDWLAYQVPALRRLIQPAPLLLVQEGRMQRRNMRKELITADELLSMLREEGVEDLTQVKAAYMEHDGRISVITGERRHGSPRNVLR